MMPGPVACSIPMPGSEACSFLIDAGAITDAACQATIRSRGTLPGQCAARELRTLVARQHCTVMLRQSDGPQPSGDNRKASAPTRSFRFLKIAGWGSRPLPHCSRFARMSCQQDRSVVKRREKMPGTMALPISRDPRRGCSAPPWERQAMAGIA